MNAANAISIRRPLFQLPVMRGIIERRILVNFRCDPGALSKLLPPPFRPKLIKGVGMAGICLIRLGELRPDFWPLGGFDSENAAHRIAVEWDDAGAPREGVFIVRRDTTALINRLVGGRLFPGDHHPAKFQVHQIGDQFDLEMRSDDGTTSVRVSAHVAKSVPPGSVFDSLGEASEFFRGGAVGWSPRRTTGEYDGMELNCGTWQMEALAVEQVESSFFQDRKLFPHGSAKFDSAFLMRGISHDWHARGRMRYSQESIA